MATVSAMDKSVHHLVILEFDLPSYRTGEAQERQLQTTITPDTEWRVASRFLLLN